MAEETTKVNRRSVNGSIVSAHNMTRNGKESVVIRTSDMTADDQAAILSRGQVDRATSMKGATKELIGGKLNADFYAEGEKLFNEAACTKDGTIIRSYDIELPSAAQEMVTAVKAGFTTYQAK